MLTELASRARRAPLVASAAAREAAALHVLDTVGCAAAATDHPTAALLREVFPDGGLRSSVLIEATLAHLDEFDAIHAEAAVVPAPVVIPAALHVAARENRTGADVIDAVLAGYETVIEAGLRFGGPALYQDGWLPTAVFGALGAAAATATLLRQDEDAFVRALGVAAAGIGGLLSADDFGEAHYLLIGKAASDGVEAAYLARAGGGASRTLLDLPAAAALHRPPSPATPQTGVHLEHCSFKAYPCSRPLHAAIDALKSLADEGVPLAAASRVEVRLPTPLLRFVNAHRTPSGPPEAAASAVFATAGVIHGHSTDVRFYRSARLDPALPVPEVALVAEESLNSYLPAQWPADITAVLPDGTRPTRRVLDSLGSPARPLTREEVIAKFTAQTGPAWSSWRDLCLTLDTLPQAAALLTSDPRHG